MRPSFEWDAGKARENQRKHNVGFPEATSIFLDPLSITVPDPQHSLAGQRYIAIGLSGQGRLLVLVYTEQGGKIRVISARKATSAERKRYEEA